MNSGIPPRLSQGGRARVSCPHGEGALSPGGGGWGFCRRFNLQSGTGRAWEAFLRRFSGGTGGAFIGRPRVRRRAGHGGRRDLFRGVDLQTVSLPLY